jgi:hypothetical protein
MSDRSALASLRGRLVQRYRLSCSEGLRPAASRKFVRSLGKARIGPLGNAWQALLLPVPRPVQCAAVSPYQDDEAF